MKQIVAVGCLTVLALIVMDTSQVVVTPSGLTVARGGQALAADMPASAARHGASRQGESTHRQGQGKRPPAAGRDQGLRDFWLHDDLKAPLRRGLSFTGDQSGAT